MSSGVKGAAAGSRASIPSSVKKTIEDIKEITGQNHSEDEIYAVLKECSMDPNETTQKLLLLGERISHFIFSTSSFVFPRLICIYVLCLLTSILLLICVAIRSEWFQFDLLFCILFLVTWFMCASLFL